MPARYSFPAEWSRHDATWIAWPFLRDRRIDAYAPILSRYLGA